MIKVFGIKNCDTMKKAMAWLSENQLAFEFIDYKKAGVVTEALPDWIQRAGWQNLINTRGLTWRKLSEADRADLDEARAMRLMETYPTLIRRPVLDTGTSLLIGFDPEKYLKELK